MKDNSLIKFSFGGIIFLFSVALAYFTAHYMDSNHILDYWPALAMFGGAYVVIGVIVFSVLAVSLGFLFAADVVILHLLIENYGKYANVYKLTLIGVILLILYFFVWWRMRDSAGEAAASVPGAPTQRNY